MLDKKYFIIIYITLGRKRKQNKELKNKIIQILRLHGNTHS